MHSPAARERPSVAALPVVTLTTAGCAAEPIEFPDFSSAGLFPNCTVSSAGYPPGANNQFAAAAAVAEWSSLPQAVGPTVGHMHFCVLIDCGSGIPCVRLCGT